MKTYLIALFVLISTVLFAQKPCEYITEVTDSLGTLKETKGCLVYERVFGNTTQFIFLSLISDNGTPMLNLQIIQKSPDFIAPKCLDKNSRVYFQLTNSKIYTLLSSAENQCDTMIFNDKDKVYNRVLNANFLFLKNDFEDLKKLPISIMRIKFASETIDYVLNKELVSEKLKITYYPDNFFVDNFKCIE